MIIGKIRRNSIQKRQVVVDLYNLRYGYKNIKLKEQVKRTISMWIIDGLELFRDVGLGTLV